MNLQIDEVELLTNSTKNSSLTHVEPKLVSSELEFEKLKRSFKRAELGLSW
jgi:hypothetical protein